MPSATAVGKEDDIRASSKSATIDGNLFESSWIASSDAKMFFNLNEDK